MIYIDSREPSSEEHNLNNAERWFTAQGLNDVELKRKALKIGDFLISTNGVEIPIERKKGGDFTGSLVDGRLNNQLYNMSKHYPISYLIFVGNVSVALEESQVSRKAFLGALTKASLRKSDGLGGQIVTITVENDWDLALCVYYLYKSCKKGDFNRYPSRIGSKSDFNACLLTLYSCFPALGTEKAKNLVNEFPTLNSLLRASIDDISRTKGIGKETATKIYNFLHSQKY